jgi:hypothetical protein
MTRGTNFKAMALSRAVHVERLSCSGIYRRLVGGQIMREDRVRI